VSSIEARNYLYSLVDTSINSINQGYLIVFYLEAIYFTLSFYLIINRLLLYNKRISSFKDSNLAL